MELKDAYRWVREYTWGINLEEIEWLCLNEKELHKFLHDNYLDFDTWNYVRDDCYCEHPLGMHYMSYNLHNNSNKYFIGVCNNKINKKTIVCALCYSDEYKIFSDQTTPITYIYTAEVNKYFRNRGLSKKMFNAFSNIINPNQHIISTPPSEDGKLKHTFVAFKQCLIDNGFDKSIIINDNDMYIYSREYHDMICSSDMKLKKDF